LNSGRHQSAVEEGRGDGEEAVGKRRVPKAVLRIPDLDQAKSAVLNSSGFKGYSGFFAASACSSARAPRSMFGSA
jgi:hypothetical protein